MPRFTTRDFGYCLKFNGSTAYVSIPDNSSFDMTGDLTISAWIMPTPNGNFMEAVFKGNNNAGNSNRQYGVGLTNGNLIRGALYIGTTEFALVSTITPIPGKWYNVILTRTGTAATLYVNGTSAATAVVNGNLNTTTDILALGRLGGSNAEYYQGYLDEIMILRVGLTATQASQMYYGQNTNPSPASLVGYYKLDDGSGTSATDSSGNSFTGTLSGTTIPVWDNHAVFSKARTLTS